MRYNAVVNGSAARDYSLIQLKFPLNVILFVY